MKIYFSKLQTFFNVSLVKNVIMVNKQPKIFRHSIFTNVHHLLFLIKSITFSSFKVVFNILRQKHYQFENHTFCSRRLIDGGHKNTRWKRDVLSSRMDTDTTWSEELFEFFRYHIFKEFISLKLKIDHIHFTF